MWLGLIEAPPKANYVWGGSKSALNYSNWDSMQPDSNPGVNFINILLEPFSHKSVLRSFYLVTVRFCSFWRKNIVTKLLVKC